MFCEKCGNELQPKEKFCGKCGAPVKKRNAAKKGKEGKKQGKKAWIIGIFVFVVCVAVSVVGVVVIKPYCEKLSSYKEAEALLKDGEYSKAYKTFEKLKDFKNAESRLFECQYGMAGEAYKNEKFKEAKEIYEQLEAYSDSAKWVTKCQYEIAKELYLDRQYEDAIDAFTEIDTYEDSEEQIQNCYYELGEEAYQTSDYESAMSYLEKAPDVKEAKELYQMLEWRRAYIEVLEEEEFYYDNGSDKDLIIEQEEKWNSLGISLAYIDEDDIPELIIYRGNGNHGDGCWIYTMIDENAQKVTYEDFEEGNCIDTFGSCQEIQIVPKKSLICSPYTGMGAFTEDYYKLKDGNLEHVVELLETYTDGGLGGDEKYYYIDQVKVSKKKYMQEKEALEKEYALSNSKWVGCIGSWWEENPDPNIFLRDNNYSVEEMMDQAIRTFCEK